MPNHRFKLSDMIPNAWFYKLKYMNTSSSNSSSSAATSRRSRGRTATKNPNPNPNPSYPSLIYSSYSIPASLDPPRASTRRSRRKPLRRRAVYRPSRRYSSNSDDFTSPSEVEPDSSDEDLSSNLNLGFSATDIVLDMKAAPIPKLPPIVTKPEKRANRIATRGGRRSVSRSCVVSFRNKRIANDSVAMAKMSVDPVGDFRDSMEEMITEYGIKDSADLEDLLACYLSLNSSNFHGHIVRAFEQIWFGMIRSNV